MKLLVIYFAFSIVIAKHLTWADATDYEGNIQFYTWNTTGAQIIFTIDNQATFLEMCNNTQNWTIVSHAWQENINEPWTMSIVQSFLDLRGGCVMFMDYDYYAKMGYGSLVDSFDGIVSVVISKLQQMEQLGFNPKNAFLFGYGFSAHLFFVGAYNYAPCTIGQIDACQATKSQFGNDSDSVQKAKRAAKKVICYHTDNDRGTDLRYCQKDINFGRCGIYQPASVPTSYTSHELCPYIYNNTFTVNFNIVPKSTVETYYNTICYNKTVTPSLLPNEKISVGPRLNTCILNGEYYALTSNVFPYNVPS